MTSAMYAIGLDDHGDSYGFIILGGDDTHQKQKTHTVNWRITFVGQKS